jgi:hypothetical protein
VKHEIKTCTGGLAPALRTILMKVLNKKEIVIFGLKRSGNHAIIFWLLQHLGRHTIHLNDVTGESPYDSCTEINARGLPLWRCKPKLWHLCRNFWLKGAIEYKKKDHEVNWSYIRHFSPKDCLILSYENRFLDDDAYAAFGQRHDFHVGCSAQHHRVVVLRDAFNLFASLHRAPFIPAEDMATCVRIYKQYAELFLDAHRQKEMNTICVNYNEWFSSRGYRIELASKFGVAIGGEPFLAVPSIGGGSSFDRNKKDGRAQRMKVLERWQACRNDPAYRAIFEDRRLVQLSEAVFGRIVPAAW